MVQVPPPLQTIPHKPRPSIYRCKPLTPRNSLSSPEFAFSLAKHNNALERAAVRGITSQILASHHSSLPKLKSTTVAPVFTGSVSSVTSSILSQGSLTPQTPFTPPSPKVDQGSLPGIKPKADIFRNTTKSDELLDMTLAALHCIYVADFSQDSGSSQPKLAMQSGIDTDSSEIGAYRDCCDQSPGLIDESSVSSGSSTPDSISTPPSTPPDVSPEIACPSRGSTPEYHTAPYSAAAVKAKMQSIGHTQSLPSNYRYQAPTAAPRLVAEDKPRPVLEDKSLRWFLTELLRRSRASASVVQLALHYLKQAREPIRDVLNQKFKSVRVSGEDGSDIDSPLVDPRKLVLAAIMLSTKILHDHAPNSRAWSRVCGLEARQVSACESALGQALNWELMHMIVGPRDDSVLFE